MCFRFRFFKFSFFIKWSPLASNLDTMVLRLLHSAILFGHPIPYICKQIMSLTWYTWYICFIWCLKLVLWEGFFCFINDIKWLTTLLYGIIILEECPCSFDVRSRDVMALLQGICSICFRVQVYFLITLVQIRYTKV